MSFKETNADAYGPTQRRVWIRPAGTQKGRGEGSVVEGSLTQSLDPDNGRDEQSVLLSTTENVVDWANPSEIYCGVAQMTDPDIHRTMSCLVSGSYQLWLISEPGALIRYSRSFSLNRFRVGE